MSLFQIVGATLRFLSGLVWAILAYGSWRFLRLRRPQSWPFRLVPILASLVALTFMWSSAFWFVPMKWHAVPTGPMVGLYVVSDLLTLAVLAVLRHFVWYLPDERAAPPSRSWLLATYGSAALVATFAIFLDALIPLPTHEGRLFAYRVIYIVFQLAVLALCAREMARLAHGGMWRPTGPILIRRADVAVMAAGGLALAGVLLVVLWNRGSAPPVVWLTLDLVIVTCFTIPVAVRILGDVVRVLLFTAVTIAAATALYLGGHALADHLVGPAERRMADLAIVLVVVLALAVGQPWLRGAIDRIVFRPSRRRHADLQASLHALSPELGIVECARRALAALTRVMQLQGAAVMLRDGEAVGHGALPLDGLVRVWPRGASADVVPARTLTNFELRELPAPARPAVYQAEVVLVAPVASPRARWGHLLVAGRPVLSSYTDADLLAIEAFTDQLALLFDGADLLARAVAVERALAHAEKLAAIGDTAARIAHDIRNPVAAARSLAQQLARDAAPADRDAAGVILEELDRVERQIASLLRFARREELRREPLDLGELVGGAVEHSRPRLEAAGIRLTVDAPPGVRVHGDPEKLRQALLNLVDNAADAVGGAPKREIAVQLAAANGCATLRVTDSGPGVPAEALPRLFEPFFSLKPHGTGLGLAIVKRTVDAHGGTIAAVRREGSGMAFELTLPLEPTPA